LTEYRFLALLISDYRKEKSVSKKLILLVLKRLVQNLPHDSAELPFDILKELVAEGRCKRKEADELASLIDEI
jgi:hypothetical protein